MTLGSSLEDELRLMDELAIAFLKTYQVWHHRRLIITQTCKPAPELAFISQALQEDSKNYHTWSYRQWLLAHFNDDELWSGELEFVNSMLATDLRNNSAWHHRFFVVFQCGVRKGEEDRQGVFRRELACVPSKSFSHPIADAPSASLSKRFL
jgi:protein farnesyltransferase/geranylgeranyltransferase type-1 subunit alpha